MITLSDIDNMFPQTRDGSVYSDLYKDLYGTRPRNLAFKDIQDFQESWNALSRQLEDQLEEERVSSMAARDQFDHSLNLLRQYFPQATQLDIMRYLADANGCYDDGVYDWEYLDYKLNLATGTCEEFANA